MAWVERQLRGQSFFALPCLRPSDTLRRWGHGPSADQTKPNQTKPPALVDNEGQADLGATGVSNMLLAASADQGTEFPPPSPPLTLDGGPGDSPEWGGALQVGYAAEVLRAGAWPRVAPPRRGPVGPRGGPGPTLPTARPHSPVLGTAGGSGAMQGLSCRKPCPPPPPSKERPRASPQLRLVQRYDRQRALKRALDRFPGRTKSRGEPPHGQPPHVQWAGVR